jgi:UDP-GlcNAc:undecaprenyl-phosphate/decaprenyl-phosphate GlcNAc-1-phosphate transferase
MSLILTFSLSLFLSIVLVPFFIRHAARLGLVDVPDGTRKIHQTVIPRCGGIAIALATLLPAVVFAPTLGAHLSFVAGALIIVAFGILDDKYDLDFRWKFLGQILAVIVVLIWLPELVKLPFFLDPDNWKWLGYVGIFVFILGATNAVNLSDGLDGLAGGAILLSLAVLAFLAWQIELVSISLIAVALIGALLGFLRYNTHPAIVFMGDTGSQFIGFTAALLSILLTQHTESAYSALLPLLIIGLPLIDTATVMAIRISQGKSPFAPDKNHIHHRLMRLGFLHNEAVAIIYIVQILFMLLTYVLCYSSDIKILVVYFIYAGIIISLLFGLEHLGWQFRKKASNNALIERRNAILRRFGFLHAWGPYLVLVTLTAFWFTLVFTKKLSIGPIPWIAIGILVGVFIFKIFRPGPSNFVVRVLSYSACILTFYPHLIDPELALPNHLGNFFTITIGSILALSIMVTRRESFRLDNQDILMLVLLFGASTLPLATNINFAMADMMVRLVIVLYAIEFILHSMQKKIIFLQSAGISVLFALAINL